MAPKTRTVKAMAPKVSKELAGSSMSVIKAKDVKTEFDILKDHYSDSPAKTKKTYFDNYKKVHDQCEGRELNQVPLEDMVLIAGKLSQSFASQKAFLNIWSLCNFKLQSLQASEPYKKYIETLEKGITSQMKVTHSIKMDSVATQEEILDHEDKMYIESRWSAYVACRIVRELLCRNKDLNLIVVDEYDDIEDVNVGNWLVANDDEITVIRNDYKTFKTYGSLRHELKMDRMLITACENLPRNQLLFPGADNPSKLQNRLKHSLLTSEIGYLHAEIEKIKKTGNIGRLREIAATRGSSVDQLLTSYNLGYLLDKN